jgi:hypothetical protein
MLAVKFVQGSLFLIVLLILANGNLFSQSSAPDSSGPVKKAIHIFANAAGDQAGFYNGIQYKRYPNYIHEGHPFFIADKLVVGTITYDGVQYENVKLQYDEVNDELITTDLQGDNLVQVYKPRVNAFSIANYTFTNHLSQTYPGPGYYRVLYNGKSQIIVKEKKLIQEKPGRTNAETERSVDASVDYYMKTGTGYKKFNRLNSFLSLFGKNRKAVSGFVKEKKLKFRSAKENLLQQAATYYDQLTD